MFTPIITPFDKREPNNKLALDKLKKNVEKYSHSKLTGLVVLGSNGEFPLLSNDEKIQVC